jgi:hypothetical protein
MTGLTTDCWDILTATCEEDAVIVVFVIDKATSDTVTQTPEVLLPAVIVLPLIDSEPFATLHNMAAVFPEVAPEIVLPVTVIDPVEAFRIPPFDVDGVVCTLIVLEETIIDPVDEFTIASAPAPAVPPIIVQEDKDITPEVLWLIP